MYNTCILVLSHYTSKGKHQWGGNPHFFKYVKYTKAEIDYYHEQFEIHKNDLKK